MFSFWVSKGCIGLMKIKHSITSLTGNQRCRYLCIQVFLGIQDLGCDSFYQNVSKMPTQLIFDKIKMLLQASIIFHYVQNSKLIVNETKSKICRNKRVFLFGLKINAIILEICVLCVTLVNN